MRVFVFGFFIAEKICENCGKYLTNRKKTDTIHTRRLRNMGLVIVVYILILVAVLAIHFYLASKAGEIADDKGYDGDKWKWICFWLGLSGYILVAAMPNLTMQATLKNIEEKLTKDGNVNHSLNNSSNSMMKSLSEMTPLAPLASDSSQEKTVERGGWVCKICDTRNADHDHFCKGCGASK